MEGIAMDMDIVARPRHAAAAALLSAANLPVEDISDSKLEHFFCIGSPAAPIGLVGVELHGSDALLRSLVVAAEHRTQGLGTRLVEHAENHARLHGARNIYLLTLTAEPFFARRGYRRIARAVAPARIQATREFSVLCPYTAAFMHKPLVPVYI